MKLSFALFAVVGSAALAAEPPPSLAWDAMEKTVEAKAGDMAADFVFTVTNKSDRPITITSVRPSCGCTVVDVPANPWVLAPGASGKLAATVDFTGKDGVLVKSLFVESGAGEQTLLMHIKLPPLDPNQREKNQAVARNNRQAIFRGECVQCHVIPALGKTGEDLFRAACVICHAPTNRASMVPDLFVAREHRDAAWWRRWISEGRDDSLMPAFAKPRGILTDAEIESLVEFALAKLPTDPRPN